MIQAVCECGLPIASYVDDSSGDVWIHDCPNTPEFEAITLEQLEAADHDHEPQPVGSGERSGETP